MFNKKLIAVVAVATLVSGAAFAEESYVAGGFEASGHIVTGAGWAHYKNKSGITTPTATGSVAAIPGAMGQYTVGNSAANKGDAFQFFVDEVELDLAKNLGENIRFRADLDFGAGGMNSRNGNAGVLVEQAYATANIPVGNGVEFLVGRFNAPIGFEKADTNANDTVSYSSVYRALRPNTLTGAKAYYSFTDMVDLNVYVVNNKLNGDGAANGATTTDVPAFGTRVGFNWGEEGQKSTIGFSGVLGNDHATALPSSKKHFTMLGDVDWNWWVTDAFAFGGEVIFRKINAVTGSNAKYLGGVANLKYQFNDVWDGTLKYAFTSDLNGNTAGVAGATASLTGAEQSFHELALAGAYALADGAKLKIEGDYVINKVVGVTTGKNQIFGVVGAFSYEF